MPSEPVQQTATPPAEAGTDDPALKALANELKRVKEKLKAEIDALIAQNSDIQARLQQCEEQLEKQRAELYELTAEPDQAALEPDLAALEPDLDPPGVPEGYPWSGNPWNGTWEEAKTTASVHSTTRHHWLVAMDLFILEEATKYRNAPRGTRNDTWNEIRKRWGKWNFGFELSRHGFVFRYNYLIKRKDGNV
ncbi:hypothetical protein KVR01_008920 [Diaporthe batatas]|uniref:uncharacterized protein n=1 Tax=Diaporthe batatas TaxID=748121 RepID=UPI001D039139|nr:uncharacterized protein KVR01_008920 [Diaporthe batatas]KAG8160656.1 hypothetical protein KVR01_008920 [Diaporthe batatas]